MKAFISYETALAYWRLHFPLDSELGLPANSSSAEECASRKNDVLACVPETYRMPNQPIEVLVFSAGLRRASSAVKCHVWSSLVPEGAFYRAGDMMVSSPEFVFLQMAQQLSVGQLVALGCELCGLYVLIPHGFSRIDSYDACPTRLASLTNVEKIEAFLKASNGAPGLLKASRALKYIVEGSRSPMETMACLYLSLPAMLGGYGFEKPVMNAHIDLDEKARAIAQRRYCQGDICWPKYKLDIEYHGEVHVGAAQMKSDVGRALGIEHMGWRVLTVTSPQVLDIDRFEVVAREAAKQLRYTLRKRIMGRTPARLALHQELEEWTFGNQS